MKILLHLFFDETEDRNIFAVGGIVTPDRSKLLANIYNTRRYIKNKKGLSQRQKEKLLNELKEFVLHGTYEDVKACFIKNILFGKAQKDSDKREYNDLIVVFAYYQKNQHIVFNQKHKECIYKAAVKEILHNVELFFSKRTDKQIRYNIIFDCFGGRHFEKELIDFVQEYFSQTISINPGKSNEIKELQAADICIGCVRRSIYGEDMDNYTLLKNVLIMMQVCEK